MQTDSTGRWIVNLDDYPDIDPNTDEGKEEISHLGFHLSHGRTPVHFVFMHKGKEIGEMFVRSPFLDRLQ